MNKLIIFLAIGVVIGGIIGYAIHGSSKPLGTATTDCTATTCLQGGLRLTSGDFSVASTNAATSTAALGCVEIQGTSTASRIKLVPGSPNGQASSTQVVGSIGGFMVWAYGTCP